MRAPRRRTARRRQAPSPASERPPAARSAASAATPSRPCASSRASATRCSATCWMFSTSRTRRSASASAACCSAATRASSSRCSAACRRPTNLLLLLGGSDHRARVRWRRLSGRGCSDRRPARLWVPTARRPPALPGLLRCLRASIARRRSARARWRSAATRAFFSLRSRFFSSRFCRQLKSDSMPSPAHGLPGRRHRMDRPRRRRRGVGGRGGGGAGHRRTPGRRACSDRAAAARGRPAAPTGLRGRRQPGGRGRSGRRGAGPAGAGAAGACLSAFLLARRAAFSWALRSRSALRAAACSARLRFFSSRSRLRRSAGEIVTGCSTGDCCGVTPGGAPIGGGMLPVGAGVGIRRSASGTGRGRFGPGRVARESRRAGWDQAGRATRGRQSGCAPAAERVDPRPGSRRAAVGSRPARQHPGAGVRPPGRRPPGRSADLPCPSIETTTSRGGGSSWPEGSAAGLSPYAASPPPAVPPSEVSSLSLLSSLTSFSAVGRAFDRYSTKLRPPGTTPHPSAEKSRPATEHAPG